MIDWVGYASLPVGVILLTIDLASCTFWHPMKFSIVLQWYSTDKPEHRFRFEWIRDCEGDLLWHQVGNKTDLHGHKGVANNSLNPDCDIDTSLSSSNDEL